MKCIYNLRLCQYIFQYKGIYIAALETIETKVFVSKVCKVTAGSIIVAVVYNVFACFCFVFYIHIYIFFLFLFDIVSTYTK